MMAGEVIGACLLDAVVGDPRWLPHPVRIMGSVIAWCDDRIRPLLRNQTTQRAAGILLAFSLPTLAYVVGWGMIELAGRFHWAVRSGAEILLAFTTLAARDLVDHARTVLRALESGSLDGARQAVSRIVGRDVAELSEPEVVRATVETVAESTADGVVAPLFYLTLGGAPLAMAYKAVSTLDSMIGHRDARHRYFGWASARLDDSANWVPARLTACLFVLASWFLSRRAKTALRAWAIVRRDGRKHPSPNSGWPEAAMAGSLGVQLGGVNLYDGVPEERPLLGDPGAALRAAHIRSALVLMVIVSLFAAGLATVVLL
jgi:adenosylcobinamide-phosphate synthase